MNLLNHLKYLFILSLLFTGCYSSTATKEEAASAAKIENQIGQGSGWQNLDTIKAGRFDTGTMWTFEYFPADYFEEEYGFIPDEEWLTSVRMATLKFATYCSASFISEDGLILTNNHCAREAVADVSEEGEDLNEAGFIAATLEEERRVEGLFVDQLVEIRDVTEEVQSRLDKGEREDAVLNNIEEREAGESGLIASVVPLYNGGKYSLYITKRYDDIRLVFTPEHAVGHFGGEFDNFTYPRYNLDAALFRAYDENGKPLKVDYYLPWSETGADVGEAVFVVGNPGSTNRLNTVAKLEFFRDVLYPRAIDTYTELIDVYEEMLKRSPDNEQQLRVQVLRFQNSLKAFTGMLEGLRDPVLMQRKRAFEKEFREAIDNNPELKIEYGGIWNELSEIQTEQKEISNKLYALTLNPLRSSEYFFIAADLVGLAEQLKLPEEEREEHYTGEQLEESINEIIPDKINIEQEKEMLRLQLRQMIKYLGHDNELVKNLTNGLNADEAVEYALNKSKIKTPEDIRELIEQGPDAILDSGDPFIYFVRNSFETRTNFQQKNRQFSEREGELSIKLGRALFEVYGTKIPPDATFTLRISDGVVKGYPYNGTEAPAFTTYYGMYDRYYSFNKEEPWDLPERWINPPAEFDLATKFNFVSTNDITGGNSGSPVINKEGKIVGLAFDGNIESLPGSFIFAPELNRTVSVHVDGIIKALQYFYKSDRLVKEISGGKIP